MALREDVDVHMLLADPQYAREYVTSFDWRGPAPEQIVLNAFEKVPTRGPFTDDQVVRAAQILLQDVEIPQTMREKQLEKYEH